MPDQGTVCATCQGSGKCPACAGSGQQMGWSEGKPYIADVKTGPPSASRGTKNCPRCMGAKTCPTCFGTGKLTEEE